MAVVRSQDWTFVDANERFLRLLGYPAEEIYGHCAEELGAWFMNLLTDAGKRLASGEAFRDEEVSATAKFGESKWLLASIETIMLRGDTCRLATFVDLTERKQIEETQERQRRILHSILCSMGDGVIVADGATYDVLTDDALMTRHRLELPFGFDPRAIGNRTAG